MSLTESPRHGFPWLRAGKCDRGLAFRFGAVGVKDFSSPDRVSPVTATYECLPSGKNAGGTAEMFFRPGQV